MLSLLGLFLEDDELVGYQRGKVCLIWDLGFDINLLQLST